MSMRDGIKSCCYVSGGGKVNWADCWVHSWQETTRTQNNVLLNNSNLAFNQLNHNEGVKVVISLEIIMISLLGFN